MIESDILIGKNLEVLDSTNESLVGIQGKIINETQNSFIIETQNQTKTIMKNTCTFIINGTRIVGKRIAFRPYERLKQKWNKK